jgi:hypothetical protein
MSRESSPRVQGGAEEIFKLRAMVLHSDGDNVTIIIHCSADGVLEVEEVAAGCK